MNTLLFAPAAYNLAETTRMLAMVWECAAQFLNEMYRGEREQHVS